MKKVLILLLIILNSEFALSQDSNKITFIKDKAQTSWMFGGLKISSLNEIEFSELESIVQAKIEARNEGMLQKDKINSDGYFRQYIVVENGSGEKEIWINFLCEIGRESNWKTEVILPEDGGKCYFNILVNLTNKTVDRFVVNGRA